MSDPRKDLEDLESLIDDHAHAVARTAAARRGLDDAVHAENTVKHRIKTSLASLKKVASVDRIVVQPAPGDRCGGSGLLEDGSRCSGCRACT